MKDTVQEQNAEELTELISDLAILLNELKEDAPKIRRMYDAFKQAVPKQEAALTKATQAIETASSANIVKIQKASQNTLDAAAQYLNKVETIATRCETALHQMETMVNSIQATKTQQISLDKRLTQIEEKLQAMEVHSIISEVPKGSVAGFSNISDNNKTATVSDYFKEKGFKVIDYRTSGGALWIIGAEEQLAPYVSYVEKYYGVTGKYGSGKATNGKPAWWTKDKK